MTNAASGKMYRGPLYDIESTKSVLLVVIGHTHHLWNVMSYGNFNNNVDIVFLLFC